MNSPRPHNRPFAVATVGGTFQAMHEGHQRYLEIAFQIADFVHVSITSREYASTIKQYTVKAFEERCSAVASYLDSRGWEGRFRLHALHGEVDVESIIETNEIDVAVVEPRYLSRFQELSSHRASAGRPEIYILLKPRTRVRGLEVSSTLLEEAQALERPRDI